MNVWNRIFTYEERVQLTLKKNNIKLSSLHIPKGTILDWGCSIGITTFELSKRFKKRKVIGIDYCSSNIDYAKYSYPNLEFHCMDGCDLKEILPGPYAAIFAMNNLILGLNDKIINRSEFKTITRTLKDCLTEDGILILSTDFMVVYQNNQTFLGTTEIIYQTQQYLING